MASAMAAAMSLSPVAVPAATAAATDDALAVRLANRLTGEDIAVGDARYTGSTDAVSRFGVDDGLDLAEGVTLTTSSTGTSALREDGDADLTALLQEANLGRTTRDAAVLEFTMTPTAEQLNFNFTFTTEEGSDGHTAQPDVFGLWVDGTNIALTPDGEPITAVTLNGQEQFAATTTVTVGTPVQVKLAIADATHATGTSTVHVEGANRRPIPGGTVLASDDFESGLDQWTVQRRAYGTDLDGDNTVLTTDPAGAGMQRATIGDASWTDYSMNARLRANDFPASGSWVSLIARYHDNANYYQIQLMGHGDDTSVTIRRVVDSAYATVAQRHDWAAPTGEWLDVELVASGAQLEFWVNGELILEGQDHSFTNGPAGFQSDLGSDVQFDDVVVREITNPAVTGLPVGGESGDHWVSPDGDDDNPGTEDAPWRTMAHAADVAQAGSTVTFADGTYDETRHTDFTYSGTENARIVFRSENPRGAKIVYHGLPINKLSIIDRTHITIQGFELTQDEWGTKTTDIIVEVRVGADHVEILDNHIHGAFEEGVKGYLVSDLLVRGNLIEDFGGSGIDFVNVHDTTVANNHVRDVDNLAILAKGGSTNIVVRDNLVQALNKPLRTGGIFLGGITGAAFTLDPSVNGYEAYNMVVFNNVVQGTMIDGAYTIPNGIAFWGARDSAAYYNIVINTTKAINIQPGGHLPSGWEWEPINVNIETTHNIIDTTTRGHAFTSPQRPVNFTFDRNVYHDVAGDLPTEEHGVYADPEFVEPGIDWHLSTTSPGRNIGGCTVSFSLLGGGTVSLLTDHEGNLRTADNCSAGIYR